MNLNKLRISKHTVAVYTDEHKTKWKNLYWGDIAIYIQMNSDQKSWKILCKFGVLYTTVSPKNYHWFSWEGSNS